MKRVLSIALSMTLLFMLFVPMQSATAAAIPLLSLEQLNAQAGERVQMRLSLQSNPGIVSMRVSVQYDASVLALAGVQNGEIFSDDDATFGKELTDSPYTMLWLDALSTENYTKDGTLATLTFLVLQNAKAGKTDVSLSYDASSVFDCNLESAPLFATQSGSVNVFQTTVAVTGVSIPSSLSLTAGETSRLAATVTPFNATNKTVTWKSSNASVASVDANGNVRAVSAGSAVITATTEDGGKTAACTVTVQPAVISVTGVSLPSSLTMNYKSDARLTAAVEPSNATNPAVSWTSSDKKVVEVDASGRLTTHKSGSATITVTTADGGKTASCRVTVQYTFLQKIIIYLLFGWIWYVK